MIYTTLKANQEHGVEYLDIFVHYEECYGCAGELFGDEYCTPDKWGDNETNDKKLFADFTDRQIASTVLKGFKAMAKDKEMGLLNWTTHKVFIDIDLPEIAYEQAEQLIKNGVITGASDLRDLDGKARKRGCRIRKEYRYSENDCYCGYKYIDDLIDEHFPCNVDLNDGDCINCGNCH